jgi:predicted site-specific integrase-resolvase
MNKNEVADYLGCTPRTVNRYVEQGKLKIVYINREAIFEELEVEELKRELSAPIHRSIVVNEETEKQVQKEEFLLQIATFLLAEAKKLSSQELRFTHLEDLERCCDRGWLLRSHELKELVKLKRLPSAPFSRYGFIFERVGKWWKVKKGG